MSVIERIRRRRATATEASVERYSLDQLIAQVNYLGNTYPLGLVNQTHAGDGIEQPLPGFAGAQAIYRENGPVFACIVNRAALFSEARFQWQTIDGGRPGALFGTSELALLEKPWPGGTTGDLLWRAEQDVSLAGNSFHRLSKGRLWRLRPDYMNIVLGSQTETENIETAIDAEVVGYLYKPPGEEATPLLAEEVAHWSPIPDPLAMYRGMPWITPIMRDITSDNAAVSHKLQFFNHGATPNLVVMPDATVDYKEFKEFEDDFRDQHEGVWNAYRTLFLGGGSKIEKVGLSMKDMDYSGLMGVSETRIAAAANTPPVIAGFSEGLQAATYSNYAQARRKFGDIFARPQWRSFAAALEPLLRAPNGPSRLWYDDRDIAFLREDTGDEADIRSTDAQSVRTLIEAGYKADAAVAYVNTGNLEVLNGQHSGLTSVQLVAPGDGSADSPAD